MLTFPNSTAVMTLWTILLPKSTIRDQTVTMQLPAPVSHQIVHYRFSEEQFHSFSTIEEEELYKFVKSAKPTTCMLDPIPYKLLKEVLPEVIYPLLLIIYKALNGLAPQYLSELLSHYSPPRPLRSQNSGDLIIPRISKSTTGGRSFFYLAPKLWNNLPNTVREADTLCQFKSRLKTHLFNLAYT